MLLNLISLGQTHTNPCTFIFQDDTTWQKLNIEQISQMSATQSEQQTIFTTCPPNSSLHVSSADIHTVQSKSADFHSVNKLTADFKSVHSLTANLRSIEAFSNR